MKKIFLVVCISLSMLITACGGTHESEKNETSTTDDSKQRQNQDFRESAWGDDAKTVAKYEGKDFEKTNEGSNFCYVYEREVAGYDAYAIYNFEKDNKLHSAGYNFMNTYTVGKQYILQYNQIKESLIEKYGTPYEDEILPLVDQDTIDMAGESDALEYGYVAYRCQWNTGSSDIMLGMMSQNYDIKIVITYKDKNYQFENNTDGL